MPWKALVREGTALITTTASLFFKPDMPTGIFVLPRTG